jgi:hypothetical protein
VVMESLEKTRRAARWEGTQHVYADEQIGFKKYEYSFSSNFKSIFYDFEMSLYILNQDPFSH